MSSEIERIKAVQDQKLSCPHPWKHTVYGSDDPEKNGTVCVMCGEKLR